MSNPKITQVHVYIIGGVLMLLLGVGLWFALIKPVNEENVALASSIQGTESTSVPIDGQGITIMPTWETQKKIAEEKLEEARQRQQRKAAELASLERTKQVPPERRVDLGDGSQPVLLARTMPRWLTLPQYVVTMMNSYARSSAARRNVRITTQFKAPAPSTNPANIPRDIIAWNLGPVTMNGEFNRVMQWVEDWNRAPLVTAVDGLKFSVAGLNGRVDATANITVYIFPTGQAAQIPGAAGGAAAPGAMPGMIGDPGALPAGGANGPGPAGANGPG
jgi:hypothetical protein